MNGDLVKGKSEYESLREHIAALREEIAYLTAERDELLYRECPRIQAEYDAKIGYRMLELYRAKARLLQLRRAVEILQAARNRQEEKDPDEAEREAREAFREREKELEEEAKKIRENKERQKQEEKKDEEWRKRHCGAERSGSSRTGTSNRTDAGKRSTLPAEAGRDIVTGNVSAGENNDAHHGGNAAAGSEEEQGHKDGQPPKFMSREEALKYYHRKLVKMLHPDANPNQTKEEAALFLEAEKAFQEGDLDKLIEIYDMLIAKDAELHLSDTPEDMERLREIAQTLEKKKNALLDEIEEIRSMFPYTAKELLANEEEVEKILRHMEEVREEIERQYQEMLVRFNRLKEGKDPNGTD